MSEFINTIYPFEKNVNTRIVDIGIQGENKARTNIFDITEFVENFGEGTLSILHQRPGEDYAYPVSFVLDGYLAIWKSRNSDLEIAGHGQLILQYEVDDIIVKTLIFTTVIHKSIGDEGDVPEPIEPWVDEVLDAKEAIDNMSASASITPSSSTSIVVTKTIIDDHVNFNFDFRGLGSDSNYVHTQMIPSSEWDIIHNLGKKPSVTVVDSAENTVFGEIRYIDENEVKIIFQSEFSGKAYLN